MTEDDTDDLEDAFARAIDRTEEALDAAEGETLPDEETDGVRESVRRVDEEVADASFDELLDAAGFENVPADASPGDLPSTLQGADPDAVVRLRHLLELAALGDSWSDIDESERRDRLERVAGDADVEDEDRSVGDLLSSVWSADETDDGTADGEVESASADETDDSASDGSASDEEEGREADDDSPLSEAIDGLQSKLEAMADEQSDDGEAAGEGDEGEKSEDDEETDEDEPDGDQTEDDRFGDRQNRSRFSTVPSSRGDMGSTTRFSSVRGRK